MFLSFAALAGCPSAPAGVSPQALSGGAVIVRETVEVVPEGGDLPDTVLLAHVDEEGVARPIEGRALGGVAFQGGALVLRTDHRLERVREGTAPSVIDAEAVFSPVVSADGEHAAWASVRGLEQALVVIDREGGRTDAAQGLASIGAISFDPETHGGARRIAFVGAVNGGIAGVWVTRADGSATRCLTNCALRAGQPLGAGHEPLPDELVRFEGDAILYRTGDRTVRLELPEVLR
ncbi:MAG: hypothetical protein OHK0013_42920 [Sandaracinaceae bacterium]